VFWEKGYFDFIYSDHIAYTPPSTWTAALIGFLISVAVFAFVSQTAKVQRAAWANFERLPSVVLQPSVLRKKEQRRKKRDRSATALFNMVHRLFLPDIQKQHALKIGAYLFVMFLFGFLCMGPLYQMLTDAIADYSLTENVFLQPLLYIGIFGLLFLISILIAMRTRQLCGFFVDAIVFSLCSMLAVAKWLVCTFYGCCEGVLWRGSFSVFNPTHRAYLFFNQPIEGLIYFLLCVAALLYLRFVKTYKPGVLAAWLASFLFIARFFIFYWRYPANYGEGITTAHWAFIPVCLIALVWLFFIVPKIQSIQSAVLHYSFRVEQFVREQLHIYVKKWKKYKNK
jgi:hypothetical protein